VARPGRQLLRASALRSDELLFLLVFLVGSAGVRICFRLCFSLTRIPGRPGGGGPTDPAAAAAAVLPWPLLPGVLGLDEREAGVDNTAAAAAAVKLLLCGKSSYMRVGEGDARPIARAGRRQAALLLGDVHCRLPNAILPDYIRGTELA
jgi:hypothetical protein